MYSAQGHHSSSLCFPPAVQCQSQFALCLPDTSGELPGKQNTKTKTVINYRLEWINTSCFATVYTVTQFYVILKTTLEWVVPPRKAEIQSREQMIFPNFEKINPQSRFMHIYMYLHTHTHVLVYLSINNKDLCPCGGVEQLPYVLAQILTLCNVCLFPGI